MDLGKHYEEQRLRVVVPKRGEFNPARETKHWLWLDYEATEPDVAKETSKHKLLCGPEGSQSNI